MSELFFDPDFSDVLSEKEGNPRWKQIAEAADFIALRLDRHEPIHLMFICTHNSRRSQFAHVWAEVFARIYKLDNVRCYSGGTEVTECSIRTIRALERVGFLVQSSGGANPDYTVRYAENYPPIICNSSLFSEPQLKDFAAMMCCSDVDETCPVMPRATIRIPWHYDDPKVADDTPDEVSRYDQRCREIGRDMLLLMSQAAERRKTANHGV